ncbi:MAG: ATPase [Alphaproteobacteria bacterium]|nr:ATPase [Alphaproteobacteria bacterium]
MDPAVLDRFFGDHKSVTVMGMSGVGKTRLASRLPSSEWFHYSVDYRIGTFYLSEEINDDLKRMVFSTGHPALAGLLRSDSMYIRHNIGLHNLEPLSKYLGGLGLADAANERDPADRPATNYFHGLGRTLGEFARRQHLHYDAEVRATKDIEHFKDKAYSIYEYSHFLNDASGSLCEIIRMEENPDGSLAVDPNDPVLRVVADNTLLIYIEATEEHVEMLNRRAQSDPKPLFYRQDVLHRLVEGFMAEHGLSDPREIYPASFSRYAFPRLLDARVPRYRAIADAIGVTVPASKILEITQESVPTEEFTFAFETLVREAVNAKLEGSKAA